MGNPLFGLDIASIVNDAMGGGMPDAVLIKVTPGGRDPLTPNKQLPETTTRHTAKGFVGEYEEKAFADTTIRRTDRLIHLFGESIQGGAIPQKGDSIEIEGGTWKIEGVPGRDPAGAVYDCQGR